MTGLVVYSDFVCPFCYLAWPALEQLLAAGWPVEVRAYELYPPPARAVRPAERLRAQWDRAVAPRAERLGLPMTFPQRTPRTRKAHELVQHARATGAWPRLQERLYRAHFGEGLDIGRIDVLVALASELGWEPNGVRVELDIDQYTEAVVAEEQQALAHGIRTVPAYISGEGATQRVHTGLLELPALRAWLEGAAAGSGAGEPLESGTDHDI